MTDRVTLIQELGLLEREATLRGDDRAVGILRQAAELILEDSMMAKALSQRRAKEASRQRLSRDSRDSRDRRETPGFSPTPPFPTPYDNNDNYRTRERDAVTDIAVSQLEERMAQRWPDIKAFLNSRDASTWGAWAKEMLKLLTGGQATEDDVAQSCCDALALERPLGSPAAFRAFIGRAARDRAAAHPVKSSPSTPHGRGALVLGEIRALVKVHQQPGQPERRFIRRDDVKALGNDVLRAYDAVGGADAILNTPSDKLGFLTRDFSAALEAAHAAA